jgi:hypothetical protein
LIASRDMPDLMVAWSPSHFGRSSLAEYFRLEMGNPSILAGMALYVKSVSVFIIAGGFVGIILGLRGIKRSIRDPQVWVMAALMVLPVGLYMLYGIIKLDMGGQFALRFFPKMWIDPAFYFR